MSGCSEYVLDITAAQFGACENCGKPKAEHATDAVREPDRRGSVAEMASKFERPVRAGPGVVAAAPAVVAVSPPSVPAPTVEVSNTVSGAGHRAGGADMAADGIACDEAPANQGQWGTCVTYAVVAMINRRLLVKYNVSIDEEHARSIIQQFIGGHGGSHINTAIDTVTNGQQVGGREMMLFKSQPGASESRLYRLRISRGPQKQDLSALCEHVRKHHAVGYPAVVCIRTRVDGHVRHAVVADAIERNPAAGAGHTVRCKNSWGGQQPFFDVDELLYIHHFEIEDVKIERAHDSGRSRVPLPPVRPQYEATIGEAAAEAEAERRRRRDAEAAAVAEAAALRRQLEEVRCQHEQGPKWAPQPKRSDDVLLTMAPHALLELIGKTHYRRIATAFSAPVDVVKLRRVSAHGQCIAFHVDFSQRTMQIPLNGDDEYEGGRLVFATPGPELRVRRVAHWLAPRIPLW
eukprot:g6688.t1